MALTPERIHALKDVAAALDAVPHGQKSGEALRQAQRLGCSVPRLYAQLTEAGLAKDRKRRSDAGRCAISREEAMVVMALKTTAQRANGKDNMAYGTAAALARANGLAALGAVDTASGELLPVSEGTIARAVRAYGLDLKTLRRPAPHTAMASLHPNHVWQIDASVCVLYYLDDGGLGVMEHDEFYKNKPENFAKRAKAVVIRYVCTDHFTGTVHFRYYLGAESGEMLCEFFFDCIQAKGSDKEPFQGVPFIVVLDPGSANKGALFTGVCRLLQIKVIVHRPKNPRAKGSVEKHNDLIERGFESSLIGMNVENLEQLNAQASIWRRWFNGTRQHRRHGHTRYGLWQTIRPEHLRLAPAMDVCRSLPSSAPVERQVRGDLTVSLGGESYKVESIPHLQIGQKVSVAMNPYLEGSALVIELDAEGNDVYWVCPRVELGAGGFPVGAPAWGEGFRGVADTPAVKDGKALERLAYGVEGKLAVDAARRARKPVFGGLDITGHLEAQTPASYLQRPGQAMDVASPLTGGSPGDTLARPDRIAIEPRRLNTVQLASRLASAMPGEWSPAHYQRLVEWYGEGVAEDAVPEIIDRLRNFGAPPRLVAVGGA
ncbi:MAG: hypothetical protein U1E96_08840 [Azonexus sp.]